MADALAIYRRFVAGRVRAQLQYRASFVLGLIGAFLFSFVDLLQILVMFSIVPRLGDWSAAEVAFLFGIANTSLAIADLFVGYLDSLPSLIRSGAFDQVLTRPVGTLLQVVTTDFSLRRVGRIAQGGLILGIAIAHVNAPWDPARAAMLVVTILASVVIFAAIWVIGAATTFWTVETMELTNSFTYGGQFMTSYPLNVYARWLRRFMGFALGLAFVSYLPSLYILDRPDPLGFPVALRFLGPAVAAGMALVAAVVWRYAVRHYRSTGS